MWEWWSVYVLPDEVLKPIPPCMYYFSNIIRSSTDTEADFLGLHRSYRVFASVCVLLVGMKLGVKREGKLSRNILFYGWRINFGPNTSLILRRQTVRGLTA